jgi:pimeloyl-ACP methyl ester carboxylesterase
VNVVRRLELEWGRWQLAAMQRGAAAFAGLHRHRLSGAGGELSFLRRPGHRDSVPLLCLHGFGGDKETWLLVASALPRRRGMVLLDLPGHGGSAMPKEPVTIACHAAAAVRLMDHLGLDRVVVCGNSMGGGVALRLAADHPERVAALILIASVGSDVHHHAAVAAWRTGPNPLIPSEDEIDAFVATALEGPTLIPRSVIRYVATARSRSAAKLRTLFEDFAAGHGPQGVPDRLETIAAPALVVHGVQDRVVDRKTAEDLGRQLPRSELHHLPAVGHAPQLEAPRRTARLVNEFLDRVVPDGSRRPG